MVVKAVKTVPNHLLASSSYSTSHFCIGAILARAEALIAVGTVLRRLPKLQLLQREADWDLEKRQSRVLRTLKVRF